ncbi:MBL fold metallo-hydrolase [Maritimibacter dapengensis]|uniref:MBL fold metallo-hydrolase n=1 Tax=Maritimibacter dapengensis TaxID=2836868 RepID=A0ABS6T204_9RHOB|nr:MBL fold metallo-hydrolase [Maritimibacter dapengensis]MBV7378753.1 MBL fold metallo-hydrolase [Maritimibacter dapengensis]
MTRFLLSAVACLLAVPAVAQERIESHCRALADNMRVPFVHRARFSDPLPDDTVRISYISHAAFLIQTSGGLTAVTDYTGDVGGADLVPDVVTMNNAHISHFTWSPDPDIPNVLEGWAEATGVERDHNLDLGEMLVRNVHTDIRSNGGGGVTTDGNSVFIFEAAGLCIGHLGHLHHIPDDGQYAEIGRLDVVMAAVDGGVSLDTQSMIEVMGRFRARMVIPMHWFGRFTLDRFLAGMGEGGYDVVDAGIREITVSMDSLPSRPTVMLLQPGPLE